MGKEAGIWNIGKEGEPPPQRALGWQVSGRRSTIAKAQQVRLITSSSSELNTVALHLPGRHVLACRQNTTFTPSQNNGVFAVFHGL